MSVRSLNWLKFGGLVGLAFALGLLFAGLLDRPTPSLAQNRPAIINAEPASQVTRTSIAASSMPLAALSEAFANVAEEVRPSVVYIRSRRTERVVGRSQVPQGFEEFFGIPRGRNRNEPQVESGAGSGFIVSPDGYILTNNHVVDGADQVTVRLLDRHEFTAKVVGTDANTDVAVIKIDPRGVALKPAVLGHSAETRVGEWVMAVGNPLSESLSFTVTSGIISAKGRGQLALPGRQALSIQDFIQTDAAINRGNSGGPLLNVQGQVVGINSAIYSPTGVSAGYAFAIPIDLARQVMEQLITKGKVERAALGVLVQDANAQDAEYVKLDGIYGVRINEFTDGSPAKAAGLEPGDVVIDIDGERVDYTAQLQQLVGFKKPGERVQVEVARKGGVRKTYSVRLIPQTDPEDLASAEGTDPAPSDDGESSVLRERLGASVSDIDAETFQRLNMPSNSRGVLVESVDPYGPADGLLFSRDQQTIDIIVAVEGKPVRSEAELRAAIRGLKSGEIVSLTVATPTRERQQTRVVRIKLK